MRYFRSLTSVAAALTWMESSMDLLQVGPVNMGIDLSGGNIRMAQHGLNRPKAEVGVCVSSNLCWIPSFKKLSALFFSN